MKMEQNFCQRVSDLSTLCICPIMMRVGDALSRFFFIHSIATASRVVTANYNDWITLIGRFCENMLENHVDTDLKFLLHFHSQWSTFNQWMHKSRMKKKPIVSINLSKKFRYVEHIKSALDEWMRHMSKLEIKLTFFRWIISITLSLMWQQNWMHYKLRGC